MGTDAAPETECCFNFITYTTLDNGKIHKVYELGCDIPLSEPYI
jgi:hypothetical protein